MTDTFFATLKERASIIWKRVKWPARMVLLVAVVVILARDLGAIGLATLAQNLPVTPWFYLILAINYLGLPFYETLIYHLLWRTGPRVLPVLLRKRVYNEALLEYSGETALIVWARKHVAVPQREAFRNVRDVNILSTLAGNLVTFVVLLVVIVGMADRLGVGDAVQLRRGAILTGGLVLALLALAIALRKRFLSLSLKACAGILTLHTLRLMTFMGLQALQWHMAVPSVDWRTWGVFVALQMAVSRVPMIPAKDLFFTGLAMRLGARITQNPAAIAGLFVASAALNLMVHGLMYVLGHVFAEKRPNFWKTLRKRFSGSK